MTGLRVRGEWARFAGFVILLVVLVYLLLRAAPLAWSVVQVLLLVLFIGVAVNPAVRWQEARHIPRWAAVMNIFLLLFTLVALIIWFLIPPFTTQLQSFLADLPALGRVYSARLGGLLARYPALGQYLDIQRLPIELFTGLRSFAALARTVFASTVGAIAALILVLITTLYALIDPWPLLYGVRGLFPREWWGTLERVVAQVTLRIRGWVLGTVVLSLLVGALDYLGLTLINLFHGPNLPFVFFFAILGALLEAVPVVGPIAATVLPTLVGLAIDPLLGLLVLAVFAIVQQLENNVLVPLVMRKAVALHPVSLIVSLVVMSGLLGLFGALIAVPVAATLKVLYDEWYYPLLHHGEPPLPPPSPAEEMAREEARHAREHEKTREAGDGDAPAA